jgi:hypothetical protein
LPPPKVLNVIGQVWSGVSSDSLFPYVYNDFDSGEPLDSRYMFLPQNLQVPINACGFNDTGRAVRLSGRIEILEQHRLFPQPAIYFSIR